MKTWRLVFTAGRHCFLVHADASDEPSAENEARAKLGRDFNLKHPAQLRSVERIEL
jgi:hypothetical protein